MSHDDQAETMCFDTEANLCQAFLKTVPPDWVAYPETANWDILLVHRVGGWQIGVEAKKTLNAKVLIQAMQRPRDVYGPDFRAVLVSRAGHDLSQVAKALGITVIAPKPVARAQRYSIGIGYLEMQGPLLSEFTPDLPEAETLTKIGRWWSTWWREEWLDRFPEQRHQLPDYVPEVAAGVPSPMVLSDWKIKAMRVCIWVQRFGTINRAQFRALGINPGRWMNGYWLVAGDQRGVWVAGPGFPADQIRREHPTIWPQVEADFDDWSAKVPR